MKAIFYYTNGVVVEREFVSVDEATKFGFSEGDHLMDWRVGAEVTGKWTTYEVEYEGETYQGDGRYWKRVYGESLETEYEWEGNKALFDALQQAVIDYESTFP